eukprot:9573265-Alexandrium_andersonii.AAC.1
MHNKAANAPGQNGEPTQSLRKSARNSGCKASRVHAPEHELPKSTSNEYRQRENFSADGEFD